MNKVALISGANRGIGLAVATELHRRGYRLSLGMRDPSSAQIPFDAFTFAYEARDPLSPALASEIAGTRISCRVRPFFRSPM